MKRRRLSCRIAPTGLALLLGAMVACGGASDEPGGETDATSMAAPAADLADGRTGVALPAELRVGVLSEMRVMMSALEGTLAALGRGDRAAAAEAAREGGTRVAVDQDPALQDRLPGPFAKLGMSTHVAFDRIATRIEAGAPTDTLMTAMAALLAQCNSCHSEYRLVPADPGGS